MAMSSFTGNLTNTIAKINEVSAANGWGITASVVSAPSNATMAISDSNANVLMRVTGISNDASADNHGIRCEYNNGSSYVGKTNRYGSGTLTATLYFTSHGFIIINNSARELCTGYVNVNDDGTIVCGCNQSSSDSLYDLYTNFCGVKYDESSYQNLAFTPHTNPSGTTLCNAIAVGSLGEPQIAKYMFYAPTYQAATTGETEIGGERYVAYGGMWYLKD